MLTPFWGPKHPQFKAPVAHGQVVYGVYVPGADGTLYAFGFAIEN